MIYRNPFQEKLKQLDQELKKNMVGMNPIHHSTGDWDFSSVNWELDAAQYVSAPSSLRVLEAAGVLLRTLVKTATVPIINVKEGRVITSGRNRTGGTGDKLHIIFRYQDVNNYYYAGIFHEVPPPDATIKIYRVKAGVPTLLDSLAVSVTLETWHKWRVTWWNDYVGIVIRVDRWVASAWEHQLDAYDSENNWKDIGGRVGFKLSRNHAVVNDYWIDDSSIYGLPP